MVTVLQNMQGKPIVLSVGNTLQHADEVHVFAGNHTPGKQLSNFTYLMELLELKLKDGGSRLWEYDWVAAVAYNSVFDQYVDIPSPRVMPCLNHAESFNDIFARPVSPKSVIIRHEMASACSKCSGKPKKKCTRKDGFQCHACRGEQCFPTDKEDVARHSACFRVAKKCFPALCPAFQHLLLCTKTQANWGGDPKMDSALRKDLTDLVRRTGLGGNEEIDQKIIDSSDAHQQVLFQNGKMTLVRESAGVRGFRRPPFYTKKEAASAPTPHLGLASYRDALNLIDSALERPGMACWKEDCIWMGERSFVIARIYMSARIPKEGTMYLTLGYKFQK